MVDNVESASGSGGPTFATDDISSVHHPKIKVEWGADNTVNETDAAAGKALPVQGEAAENANTTGNPLLVGGRFDSSARTLGNTDVGAIALSATGGVLLGANSGVDVGDVDVISVIPGTGATNLGKAEDAPHSSGDTGAMMLGVRQDSTLAGPRSGADGDYEPLQMDGHRLVVTPNVVQLIDNFADHTSWAALNDDAGNLASDGTNYVSPNSSTSVDKLNGSSNTTDMIIDKTLGATFNVLNGLTGAAFWQVVCRVPDVTNIVNIIIRAGADSSNYAEWRQDLSGATADQFESILVPITHVTSSVGTGFTTAAVAYMAVGIELSAETDTLAAVLFDTIIFNAGNVVEANLSADLSLPNNTNIQKVGNKIVNTGAGNVGTGTQRITIATDDVNLAAISAAIHADGATFTDGSSTGIGMYGVHQATPDTVADNDFSPVLLSSTGAIRLGANSGVDVGDVDVTSISAGANLVGDVGVSGARASGGTTFYRNIDVDESEDQVAAIAIQVFWIQCTNLDATPIFLQLYNALAASVTVGTTTADLTFCVPSQGNANGAGFVLAIPNGIAFGTALTVAATTTAGGSGGPGANEVFLNMGTSAQS